jgi:hypothetical protein
MEAKGIAVWKPGIRQRCLGRRPPCTVVLTGGVAVVVIDIGGGACRAALGEQAVVGVVGIGDEAAVGTGLLEKAISRVVGVGGAPEAFGDGLPFAGARVSVAYGGSIVEG